jgi:16S rRNA processing protein RimM
MQKFSESDELIAVGRIIRSVGLDGLCLIEPSGSTLETLKLPCNLLVGFSDKKSDVMNLADLEIRPKNCAGRFTGVLDKDTADLLRGKNIYVSSALLPALDEDEYYHFELVGMAVLTDIGNEPIGKVIEVHNFPSADTIEIERKHGDPILVPLTNSSVVRVDKNSGCIILNYAFVEELL